MGTNTFDLQLWGQSWPILFPVPSGRFHLTINQGIDGVLSVPGSNWAPWLAWMPTQLDFGGQFMGIHDPKPSKTLGEEVTSVTTVPMG